MTPEAHTNSIKIALNDRTIFPEQTPVQEKIGKKGLMWPRNSALFHEASPLLLQWSVPRRANTHTQIAPE